METLESIAIVYETLKSLKHDLPGHVYRQRMSELRIKIIELSMNTQKQNELDLMKKLIHIIDNKK